MSKKQNFLYNSFHTCALCVFHTAEKLHKWLNGCIQQTEKCFLQIALSKTLSSLHTDEK